MAGHRRDRMGENCKELVVGDIVGILVGILVGIREGRVVVAGFDGVDLLRLGLCRMFALAL